MELDSDSAERGWEGRRMDGLWRGERDNLLKGTMERVAKKRGESAKEGERGWAVR